SRDPHPRRAELAGQLWGQAGPDVRGTQVVAPDVAVGVDQRQRGTVDVAGPELNIERLPEIGQSRSIPGQEGPARARPSGVITEHLRRVLPGVDGGFDQHHRGRELLLQLEEEPGVKRTALM